MKNSTKFLIISFTLILGSLVFSQEITVKEYAIIINLSGRQRMLTQKMSKEMLLVAANIDPVQNRENLKNTSNLFDQTLLKNWWRVMKKMP